MFLRICTETEFLKPGRGKKKRQQTALGRVRKELHMTCSAGIMKKILTEMAETTFLEESTEAKSEFHELLQTLRYTLSIGGTPCNEMLREKEAEPEASAKKRLRTDDDSSDASIMVLDDTPSENGSKKEITVLGGFQSRYRSHGQDVHNLMADLMAAFETRESVARSIDRLVAPIDRLSERKNEYESDAAMLNSFITDLEKRKKRMLAIDRLVNEGEDMIL